MKRLHFKKKARSALAIGLLPVLLLSLGFASLTVYAADEPVKKDWAFFNDGSFYYEDNIGSAFGEIGFVTSIAGVDINILPLRSEPITYERTVTVAVLDTGVKIDHPDFAQAIWTNEDEIPDDGIDNDENGFVDDVHGWNFYNDNNVLYNARSYFEDAHGTHCAGLMCANNPNEIVGVAGGVSSVRIMPIKVVGGNNGGGTIADFIKGIQYAEANGADICSMSLGVKKYNRELYDAMANANMLFVVPACNGESRGVNLDESYRFPACFGLDNVVVVGNLQCDGTLHYSSNYSANLVDIAAPGTQIYSTSTSKSGYEYMTGTSMAVPFVAASLALVHSCLTDNTLMQTKNTVLTNAKQIETLEPYVKNGAVLDVFAAVTQTGGTHDDSQQADSHQTDSQDDPQDHTQDNLQEAAPQDSNNAGETEPAKTGPFQFLLQWLNSILARIRALFTSLIA